MCKYSNMIRIQLVIRDELRALFPDSLFRGLKMKNQTIALRHFLAIIHFAIKHKVEYPVFC